MKKEDNKKNIRIFFAWLSVFLTILGFIIAIILMRNDKYVMFYAKQGLVLFIGQIIIWLLSGILGWFISLLWIFWVILWMLAWVNALSYQKRTTLLVGDIAEKIKLNKNFKI